MPRAKRPLAEAGANAPPASKKVAIGSGSGKENLAATYSKETVAKLSEMLKERSLPHSGKKADLIQRLISSEDGNSKQSERAEKVRVFYVSLVHA